jgi:outer membrane protein OmpA-like peptidoglycan-associated protein
MMSKDSCSVSTLYLVGARQDKDGNVVNSSIQPIANTFIALKDDSKVATHTELDGKGDPVSVNSVKADTQVYLTDDHGVIRNFETGKASNVNSNHIEPFLLGSEFSLTSEKTQLYFPPQPLIMYNMVVHGYENWIDEVRANIQTISGMNGAGIDIDKQTNVKKLMVGESFFDSKKIPTNTAKNPDNKKQGAQCQITALVIPQTKAIAIVFSNKEYDGATVNIYRKDGSKIFSNNPFNVDSESRDVGVAPISGNDVAGCIALFYDPADEYPKNGSSEEQTFRIEVAVEPEQAELIGLKSTIYSFVERIRFPITNIAGEFEVINGDAISLEEAIFKQFPNSYGHLIDKINASDNPLQASSDIKKDHAGFASYLHGWSNNLNTLQTAGGILGAEHGVLGAKELGALLVEKLDQYSSVKTGNVSIKDSLNLAFTVYDSGDKISGLIKDIRSLKSSDLGISKNIADIKGISRALKDSDALKAIENIAQRMARVHEKLDLKKELEQVVNLSDRYTKILKKTNGFFNKAGDIAGKPLDVLSLAGAVHNAYASTENTESSRVRYNGVMVQYAKRVHMASNTVDKNKANEKLKIAIMEFEGKHHITEHKRHGNSHYLNIVFNFDRAQFQPDESFEDFIKLFSTFPDDTQLVLVGHTCNIGSPEYNMGLSLRRAESVKRALKLSEADSERVIVEGRGLSEPAFDNGSDMNQSKNRRVVAQLSISQNKQYYPSREGIDVIERARSIYTLNYVMQDGAAKKAAIAAIDLIMGAPKVHPLHAAAALVWYVGGVLMDVAEYSDTLIFGEDYLKAIQSNDHQGLLSSANQALLVSGKNNKDDRNGDNVLSEQLRLRADALSGLQRLLMRCAIENGSWLDNLRDTGELINFRDSRTDFDYKSNLEYYRVQDYLERYVLADNWELEMAPIFPVALDEQWVQLIETGKLDRPKLKEDASIFEKAARLIKEQTPTSITLSDIALPTYILPESVRQAKAQLIKGLAHNPILGANYIRDNIENLVSGHRQHTTKAKFQQSLPIHYMASESFEDLALNLKPKFETLDDEIYLAMNLYSRKLGTKSNSGWTLLDESSSLTPFDQVRVTVLLDSKHPKISAMITSKDMDIQFLPIQVSPIRLDGWNMEGPPTKAYIKKLSKEDLTPEDIATLERKGLDLSGAYGAVIVPFYMLGTNQIFGTKPMARALGSWLNTDGDQLDSLWNADGEWEMDYGYQVVVANQACTKKLVEFDDGIDEFSLTLNGLRNHNLKNSSGISSEVSEKILIDKEFLAIGKEQAAYPSFFKGAKSFCLMRAFGVEGNNYFYPDKQWDKGIRNQLDRHGLPRKGVADVSRFNWSRPVELAVLVVCDDIEKTAYENRKYNWQSIPASIQLNRAASSMNWIDGPSYDTSLKYIGEIVESDSDVKLLWDKDGKKLPAKYRRIQRLLTADLDKKNEDDEILNRLKVLSGFDADDNKFDNFLDKFLSGSKKYVYAAIIKLDYQTATGFMHSGLKPFSVISNPSIYTKEKGWELAVKLTTKGESGFSNDDVNGQFNLPYPGDFENENAHWYKPSGRGVDYKKAVKYADNIIKKNKEITQNNKAYADTEAYDPIEPISPMVPWRMMDSESTEFWSEKREDFVGNWLREQNTQRLLPMADTAVLASKSELVDESS